MSEPSSTLEPMFELMAKVEVAEGEVPVADLAGQALWRVPDERLAADIVGIEHTIRSLQAERLRRVAELDRRTRVRGGGEAATASWLSGATGTSFTSARGDVAMGRALEAMPATARA